MALRLGVVKAEGDIIVIYDADAATPAKFIIEYISEIELNKIDIVIGSRELGIKKNYDVTYYKFRRLSGRIFTLISKLIITGFQDTQCGFKLFDQESTEKLFNKLYVYAGNQQRKDAFTGAFDVELLYLAKKFNFKIKEVPILWKHYHSKRVNPIKDSWRMFKDIIRIRLADVNNRY